MILKPAKFKSTINNPSIWAIDQLCTMKIVGSATVFLLLGALVPWSPGTQAEYLSFQWSKWAWEKNLRKNLWFRTTFVFYSILKSQVWIGTWSQGHMVHRRHISASSGRNELGKKSKKKPKVLTNFYHLVYFIRHIGCMVTTGCPYVQTQITKVQTLMSNVSTLISNVQNLYSNV